MCIRDSPGGGLDAGEAPIEALHREVAEETDQQIEVTGVMAVSYTHLRAHETVLDLVCRLLLEKKNSPQATRLARLHLRKQTISTRQLTIE